MITPKVMVDGAYLTASVVTQYTAGTGVRAIIKKVTFTNNHTSGVTVTMYFVKSGGVSGYSYLIAKAHYIEAGQTWSCHDAENHILAPGDFIAMLASITSVVGVRVSGYEVV
jgi:hypothetical protein